ncbi:hypothetical protein [Shimia sp.]|uniref:hypothetical protein n=1 Tax=Shimia sp. TaxID=1954381 RepID=UPI003BA8E7D2
MIAPAAKLAIYRRNLARYEAAGKAELVRIQTALIARIEKDIQTEREKTGGKP